MATKKPAKAPEGALAYIAQRNIQHDQVDYSAGETLHLDEHDAKPLLACGAIVPAEAAK